MRGANGWLVAVVVFGVHSVSHAAGPAADTIYQGGTIITMNDARPSTQAVAVKDGKILAIGSTGSIAAYKGAQTRLVNLAGKTMTPGFIDPHGHFIFALEMADQANASAPPVGTARNPKEIATVMKKFADARKVKPGELVVGSATTRT